MKNILSLFNKNERKGIIFLFLGILLHGFIELLSVASIMPFMSIVMEPEIIENNQILKFVYIYFNFTSYDNFLISTGLVVFFLLAISNAYSAFIYWWITRFVQFQSYRLSTQMLYNYLLQPYIFFLNRNSSDLSKNILSEVSRIIIGVIYPFLLASSKIIVVIFILALIIYADPLLSLLMSLILTISYGIIYLIVRRNLKDIGELSTISVLEKFKFTNEAFSGIKDVKLRGTEEEFVRRFSVPAKDYAIFSARSSVISMLPRYALETFAFGGIVLIVVYLISLQINAISIVPTISLFALAGYRLMPGLQQIYHSFVQIRYNTPALELLLKDVNIFDTTSNISKSKNNYLSKIPSFNDKIILENVIYSYPRNETKVLRGINVEIKCNTITAFVGSTGSGKTTLIDILLGLLEINNGKFTVDGNTINSNNIKSLQKQFGYVPQQIYLTDDTINKNIAFATKSDEIDLSRVKTVAKLARLDSFISSLPDKYNTFVGERGVRLSGGQIQRIGIARALYNDPKILVFDEATSALDNITENNIMHSIQELSKERTIILVAHRLSTIKNCDKIYLIDNGIISDSGSYADLKNRSQLFQNMIKKSEKA